MFAKLKEAFSQAVRIPALNGPPPINLVTGRRLIHEIRRRIPIRPKPSDPKFPGPERRAHERFDTGDEPIPLWITSEGGQNFPGELLDFSEGGARVTTNMRGVRGEKVAVGLAFQDMAETFYIQAVVVHSNGPQTAIRFVYQPAESTQGMIM